MIHGHADIREALERELPAVSLFQGPPSVGKWALAEYLRERSGVLSSDVLRLHKLDADSARAVVRFSASAPVGRQKMALIRLDGATSAVQNILLKTLEEPDRTKFFLVAERPVLPAVASRAVLFRFGLLSDEEVAAVLADRNRLSATAAAKLAALGAGRVREAMKQSETAPDRNRVMTVIRGLRDRDLDRVESMASEWTDETTDLLAEWCAEAVAGRPRYFSAEEISLTQLGRQPVLRILQGLADAPRARWVVRSIISPLLRGA